mgnify:CR=1 FL=1
MAQVELKNVGKRFGDNQVVEGVNLSIADNEFIVLVGPSGCGKSTILRMIAGLEKISDGEISISSRVVNHVPPKDRDVAMVFQNYALYPHMSVAQNMGFSLKMRRRSKEETEAKVKQAAEILGLTEYLQRKPAALSGGQRQRVAMGRAIVRKPEVFLFDEPLSNLDAQLRTQMRIELKKLHMKLETTTIYVTHDQIEAMTLADRIVVLKDGRVQQVGTPIEVFENPVNRFVAGFIGNPPTNVFPATYSTDGGPKVDIGGLTLPVVNGKSASLNDGDKVLVGIRPEAVKTGNKIQAMDPAWRTTVDVVLAEIVGGQSLLELTAHGHSFIAEVEGHLTPKPGEKLEVGFELNRMFLFDPDTEESLTA